MNREIKLILAVLVYSFLFVTLAICQTNISGNVEGIWTKANSPYLVTDRITVQSGDTLIIEPGVQIRFQGHYRFFVNGLLQAVGTKTDSIIFTRDQSFVDYWWGIKFIDADDNCLLKYCVIKHCYASGGPEPYDNEGGGILCLRSSPEINRCTIKNNIATRGAISCREFNGEITENVLTGNTLWPSNGVISCIESDRPIISGNVISGNRGGGISCENIGGTVTILANIIYNNSFGISGYGPGSIEILNNEIYNNTGSGIHFTHGAWQTTTNVDVLRNLIYNNSASGGQGGGVSFDNVGGSVINNIIDRNGSDGGAGGIQIKSDEGGSDVYNNIVTNSVQGEGIFCSGSSRFEIYFNNVWNNVGGDSIECSIATSGNISLDPLFVGSDPFDYHLTAGSPCVDAGDPSSPLDPDGTRADMGALYFDQRSTTTFTRIITGDIVNDGGSTIGSSWGDYDKDGDQDLFVTNCCDQNNVLYQNNGNGSFTKITEGDIVNDGGDSWGSTWGDYNNDGYLDLFVPNRRNQNNLLYKNNRDGTFTKITTGVIVNDDGNSMGSSWGDYDNDGYLDLFVANDDAQNNFLYQNNRDGSFNKITSGNIVNDGGISSGSSWGDYDNDGDLDLFVANVGASNFLYANNGDGSFTKITEGAIINDFGNSEGSSWGDYNNDGYLDLFVGNISENNFLYINNGDGTFTKVIDGDIVNDSNSHAGGSSWGDYDNDGDLDLFVANGNANDILYQNNGDGTFTKITEGDIVNDGETSGGSSWSDYDNDGDLDLFVANGGGNNLFYLNNGNSNNWINILCVGTVSNTSAIGTKVRVKAIINAQAFWQMREISGQTGSGGQNSLNAEFGLGDATIIDSIKVEWPSGIAQVLTDVGVNQFLTITEQEPSGKDTVPPIAPQSLNAQAGDGQVTLTWAKNSEPDFLRYLIYGGTSPNPITKIDSTDSISDTSKTIISLSNDTTYYFRISAVDSSQNESDYSNEVNATPTSGNLPPTVTTNAATNVNTTSATLNGTVNPNGLSTTVKFEFGTTTNYGNEITANQSPVSGTSAVPVTAELTGLTPNTEYHYRVLATNSVGTTIGSDQTFTTSANAPVVTTTAATNVNETSATLNGTVNPNGLSSTVSFEYGTTTSYGSEVTAPESPVNGTSTASVSAQVTDLSPNTMYHYRVVAVNSAGTTTGSDQTFTTSASAPTVTTSAATNVTTTSATINGAVNPKGLGTTVNFEYGTTPSYGDTITATQSPVSGTSTVSIGADLTGLNPNTLYHYRVVATNSTGTTNGNDLIFTTDLPSYPASFSLNTAVNFPDRSNISDFKTSDFRIVGLPGAGNRSLAELVSGSHIENWQAFWDNGAASDFLVEFDGSSMFNLTVGRGFWLIKNGPWNVSTDVTTAPLNTSGEVEIPLHSGWNLITNPFTSSISWSEVQNTNDISEPIWAYNGSSNQSSGFEAYIGYYFFNATNLSSLKVRYALLFSTSSATEDLGPESWRVNIELSSGEFIDKSVWFGVSREAGTGLDRLDLRKPRAISTVSIAYFHRPSWDADYTSFTSDIRPLFEESESWEFQVQAIQRVRAQLVFSGIESVPSQFDIYLIDESRAKYVNLREDNQYGFAPANEISKYIVLVGQKDAVSERLKSVLPKEFALGNNYPNPFNPSTTIPVAIPLMSEVELTIYNILGKKVKTIYSGKLAAGQYTFSWNGRDEAGNNLASGVYLYQLKTNTRLSLTDKMILMK